MGINRKYKNNHMLTSELTGTIAKWTGLSDEGVRLYERAGLLYPEKNEQNKYRTFDVMDYTMLLYGMVYRESGFNLKETYELANDCMLDEVLSAYQEKHEEQTQKLERERRQLERISEMMADIKKIKEAWGKCEITERPAMYRVEFIVQGRLEGDAERKRMVSKWMKNDLPFVMLSTRYFADTLRQEREKIQSISGLGVYAKYADVLHIEENEHIRYYPPVRAVHTILSANNEMLNPDYTDVLRFIRENNLKISGDPIGFGIVNLHFSKTFDRYYHIWVPVEE